MDLSLYSLYNDFKSKKILLCYSGPISQTSVEGVGNTLRRNLEIEEAGNITSISVFSIFVEQVQNIINYSAESINHEEDMDNELRVGVIVIGKEENDNYFVYCGNKVYNRDIARITSLIKSIQQLNKDELKALYKERRRIEPDPGSKGAGLGLIEMGRRAAKPLGYSFEEIDGDYSFFSLKVEVGR